MAKARRIVIETRTFDKVGDASDFFSAILRSYDIGSRVEGADAQELHALIKRHDELEEKSGAGIAYFEVNLPPEEFRKNSHRCFWIVRVDGSKIDFSIKHCLIAKSYD